MKLPVVEIEIPEYRDNVKASITVGIFDVIQYDTVHLLEEMRKFVIPSGRVILLVPDDYTAYKETGKFPIQPFAVRERNARNFADFVIEYSDQAIALTWAIDRFQKAGYNLTFVWPREQSDGLRCRDTLRSAGIPVRQVKGPKTL